MAIASLAALVPAAPVAAAGGTWNIAAGNLDGEFTEMTTFYPARITVNAGDNVIFTPLGAHTVTFNPVRIPGGPPTFAYANPTFGDFSNNPLTIANAPGGAPLNSGAIAAGPGSGGGPPAAPNYTLRIDANAAGEHGTTYQFFCMFHRDMTGFITVLSAGAPLPSTDLQNQHKAGLAMAADVARAHRALARATSNVQDNKVAAGLGLASVQNLGATSIARFAPPTIEINVGQSVTWINRDLNVPHTVTFGPEIFGPDGGPSIAPYGPTTIGSIGDQASSGFLISQALIDYVNAGVLLPPNFVPTLKATYTFTKAGTYPYYCALHDFLGMRGTVIVTEENNQQNG